jgi:ribosome-associated toxin RatA of RatAB toxin-antitoxin module
MADVQKTVLIRHSAEQMFDLVTDVADYPNFLPWCGGVEVRHRDDTSKEANYISMRVGRSKRLRVAKCCLIPLKIMSILATKLGSSR